MAKSNKFGTFGGVFVPSILTILGVIMYLRLPMIVGEAGLWATIGIIVIAHIISVTTGLSVSSIATDKKVEAGGTYYMISRSLGLPIGGTLGLALFVGLSFSVSLYLIGFSESFLSYWGFSTDIDNIRLTGSIVLLAVTILTFISTSLAIKTQYFIMAAIGLSLLSIFIGDHEYTPSAPLFSNPSSTIPLMVLFGIFFPAVTGFEAGVSMSGDLKDPKKSIPKGSIMAIAVGFVVYILLAFFLAYTVDGKLLAEDPQVLLKISRVPELVIAGIWGATLSSALGSILGAPRILQATAIDKITPKIFGKGYGPTNEPRNALILTFLIAEAGILIGELDVIARVVSIFFITTYGFLNISAAFERWTSTDFRPEFKIPGWISFVGALACIIVMIQLDFVAMLAAVVILGLLYLYLKRKELSLDSGDAWSGVWASLVKTGLTKLTKERPHKRNWRPNVIMFTGNPANREHLVSMGKAICGKLGILSAFELVKSDEKILAKAESNLEKGEDAIGYFKHKLYCRDIYEGMDQIARVYGFSGIEPNTVLMGWSKQPTNREKFLSLMETFSKNAYNTLFLNYQHEKGYGQKKRIDIWWSGSGRNLALAINLVRQITNSLMWKEARVRILIINPHKGTSEEVYKKMMAILENYRLEADVKIIEDEYTRDNERNIITTESADSDLTILGIPDRRFQEFDQYYDQLNTIISAIGTSLIINASSEFEELEVIPKTSKTETETKAEEIPLTLPPIPPARYPEITVELEKIDLNGQKAIEVFYGKSLNTIFKDHVEVLEHVQSRLKTIEGEMEEIEKIPESFKRKKAIDRLKNEVFYQFQELITEEVKKKQLERHAELLEEYLKWYLNKLEHDIKLYPRKLKITYQKEDFTIRKEDALGIKIYKIWKKTKHAIVGMPITGKIAYRELARFYQLENQWTFWQAYLTKYAENESQFYETLRKQLTSIIDLLDQVERKIWSNEAWEITMLNPLIKEVENVKNQVQNDRRIFLSRAKVAFRKNLLVMGRDMERIDPMAAMRRKRRSKKYYAEALKKLMVLPDNYKADVGTLLNMLSMELTVHSVKNRQEMLLEEYLIQLEQVIKNNYLKKLKNVLKDLEKADSTGADQENFAWDKFKFDLDYDTLLYEEFEDHLARMINLTEELPESIEVYSLNAAQAEEEKETQEIPVARMAEYFMKSRYETPVEEYFEHLIELLKRSVFSAQDALSLAQFSLENTADEVGISFKEILEECTSKIKTEYERVVDGIDEFRHLSTGALEQATEPLSLLKIQESAEDFLSGFRTYQGQQVVSGAENILHRIGTFTQHLLTRLWYVRSKALLKTSQAFAHTEIKSTGGLLLDFKESVSPKKSVIQSLPQYYISLFNGKSNIGRDFWISRPEEEAGFKKAYLRFKEGTGGAILILGERNSGKTAFCRHLTQYVMKVPHVYSVFPPLAGSSSVADFAHALSKATMKSGSVDQIISRLPADSIVVINDLELFWERTTDGIAVIEKLCHLIDKYGDKILFVINMNPHAYQLINQWYRLKDRFTQVINMQPFTSEDLKDLVLRRHKSSGMGFGYKSDHKQLSELKTAALFDNYFLMSRGNPGTALNAWLASIVSVSKDFIQISKPSNPSLSTFKSIDEEWLALLVQFVLHKRLTNDRIKRIFEWDNHKTRQIVTAMKRAGLVAEKSSEVYHLDMYMQPFIVAYLKDKEVLC